MPGSSSANPPSSPSLNEAFRLWLRVGILSFGGPAGQIAAMHRLVVEERRWLDEDRFLHALNFCMLLPGPEAQQLATYVGWLTHRTRGAIMAGTLFVLPGFLVMMGLAALYAGFQRVPLVEGIFYGIKPAVLAVVIEAVLRIGRRALTTRRGVAIAVTAFVGIFALDLPFPLIVAGAALWGWASAPAPASSSSPPPPPVVPGTLRRGAVTALIWLVLWWLPPLLALAWGQGAFGAVGVFFAKMAVVTFGGAYAVLAYVAQQAVEVHGWLDAREMLDGLGLAETTPGPLILVNQFVGFLAGFRQPGGLSPWLGGVLGAAMTVWVTFVPSFMWILVGAPHMEALRDRPRLTAALGAVTAAVVGVIVNLAAWFALHVVFARVEDRTFGPLRLPVPDPASLDPAALALALAAGWVMLRLRLGMAVTLGGAAVLGAAAKLLFLP